MQNLASAVANTGTQLLVSGALTTATHGAIDAVASTTKMTASVGIGVASWLISTAIIKSVTLTATGLYYGGSYVCHRIWGAEEEKVPTITASPSMTLLTDC